MTPPDADEDLVPISVRLGTVVPPEDPEDWTRPLTWVSALGMLAAPALALAWFTLAAPSGSEAASLGTYVVAIAVAAGAAIAGATQLGRVRAFTGTLGAGLLAALLVVIAGAATAGERQVDAASPTLAHAVAASVAGLAGVVPAAVAGWLLAASVSRLRRGALTAALGVAIATLVLPKLF